MAATRLGILLCAALAGCASAEESQDPLAEALDRHDTCLAAIEQEAAGIKDDSGAATIQELIAQTARALSPRLRSVVQSAAKRALPDIRRHSRGELGTAELLSALRTATYFEFGEHLDLGATDCGFAAFEVLPNLIYRHRGLDRAPLREAFNAIELYDSYDVQRSVMLMLTMEASGEPWEPMWFAAIGMSN